MLMPLPHLTQAACPVMILLRQGLCSWLQVALDAGSIEQCVRLLEGLVAALHAPATPAPAEQQRVASALAAVANHTAANCSTLARPALMMLLPMISLASTSRYACICVHVCEGNGGMASLQHF